MRKKLLLSVFSLIGMISTGNSFAQENHFKCGSHTQMQKLYAENPGLEADYKKLMNRYTENRIVNGKAITVRIIPIVFHIVHEYGEENISDLQVIDQVKILNRDFRKKNADTSVVISPFDTIIGDAHIEFRLATIDPYGNPTNGIEHIFNHNTNLADDYSKLNQWNRDEYLNVWTTGTIGSSGTAGYAYYPTGVTGSGFWRDGIIILHNYVGSIGTGTVPYSRALTHEIGHYLGLAHTWGNDNDPGALSSCNQDDGIRDTPNCIGMTTCQLGLNSCNDTLVLNSYWGPSYNPVDNAQNYMDYSYCSVMFTRGQCSFMNNVLDQETSARNNLYTHDNLVLTGTDTILPSTSIPVADFYVDVNAGSPNIGPNAFGMTACVNNPIAFKDASWKATITSWEWSFPGGSPSSSTSQTPPNVTYAAAGWYPVTLKVSNANGSDTKTIDHMIYIQGDWADYYGPRSDNFNQNADFWIVNNPEENSPFFHRVTSGGRDNTACFKLNNFRLNTAQEFTEDWFYNDRLGNSKDYLISPAFDLRNTSNVNISFDYAYGTKANVTTNITEKLIVYYSRDCGKTWVQKGVITGAELASAGYVGNEDYVPNNNLQWKTKNYTYSVTASDNKTRFKFEFFTSDFSSNFYFDNFNISGTLGIEDNGVTSSITIAPNPVASGSDLSVEIPNSELGMQLIVMDLKGAIISTMNVPASSGVQTVNVPMNVAKGCYILNAIQGAAKSTHRVVVY
ncbi:M43 family zinc metalloprotease [Fluviicola taffensis]|uniref:PKD domain containing protein n=1 Tax=Fluviicola taffensis (strain DSM 16823 / NCIMB 13979 / RW262) TaxID=755732 RepID=F2II11_FLUTR|nr:M43 family zinc metalloprotease [Fluviicola taffensis]AEA42711.1 PKD domain containing protein [Fluviicola taffensis DSM 16823]